MECFNSRLLCKFNDVLYYQKTIDPFLSDLIADAASELAKAELSAGEGFIAVWKIVHHNVTYHKTS